MLFTFLIVASGILAKLYVDEHYELMSDIIRRIETEVSKVPALQWAYNTLIAALSHEEAANARHKLIESDEMKAINKWRLKLVTAIYNTIKLRLSSPDANQKSAAELLKAEIVDKFPDAYKHTKEGKTGYIDNLLKALNNQRYQTAIVRLDLLGLINELSSANTQYDLKLDIVTDGSKQNKEIGSPSEVRVMTDDALKELILDVESVHRYNERTDQDEDVREAVTKIAFIINGILEEAKRNDAHKKHSRKNEDPTDSEDDISHRSDEETEADETSENY
jgi:hypothetical protein